VYTCGSTLHGKLGKNASTRQITKFALVNSLTSYQVKQVACNDYLTLILIDTGSVLQLGGSPDNEPKLIRGEIENIQVS
jgi:alpha-tubulin suppressor-like RCC1 family protein